jgi:hypothetical protein
MPNQRETFQTWTITWPNKKTQLCTKNATKATAAAVVVKTKVNTVELENSSLQSDSIGALALLERSQRASGRRRPVTTRVRFDEEAAEEPYAR